MKLPTVYICFEQCGTDKPEVRSMEATESAAKAFCRASDFIPQSGSWFYRPYTERS